MYCSFRIKNLLVGLGSFGCGVLISSAFTAERTPSSEDVKVISTVSQENIAVPVERKTCVPPLTRTVCILTEESSALVDEVRELEKRLVKVKYRPAGGIYAGRSEKQLESLRHDLEVKLRVLRERARKLGEHYLERQRQFDETVNQEICKEN